MKDQCNLRAGSLLYVFLKCRYCSTNFRPLETRFSIMMRRIISFRVRSSHMPFCSPGEERSCCCRIRGPRTPSPYGSQSFLSFTPAGTARPSQACSHPRFFHLLLSLSAVNVGSILGSPSYCVIGKARPSSQVAFHGSSLWPMLCNLLNNLRPS